MWSECGGSSGGEKGCGVRGVSVGRPVLELRDKGGEDVTRHVRVVPC